MIVKNENNSVNNISLNHIFRKTGGTFIIKVIGLVAGFTFTFLVTRYYGTENFGLFSIGLNVVQLFVLISVFGFDNTLLKETAKIRKSENHNVAREMYNQLLKISLVPVTIFTLTLFLSSTWLAENVFHNKNLAIYLKWSSFLILPNCLLLLHASGLRGLDRTGWFAFFRETSRFFIAIPVLLIIVYFNFEKFSGPMAAYLFAVLLTSIWSFWIWLKSLKGSHTFSLKNASLHIKEIYSLAFPFFLISLFGQLSPLLNSILLGIIGTAEDVGVFNIALKIAGLISLPLLAVNMASANSFAEMTKENLNNEIEKTAKKTTRLIFWTSLPLLIGCILYPDFVMGIFGSQSGQGTSTLIIISFAQFVNAITGSSGVIMQMTGHENMWFKILLTTTVLNVLGMFLLVPYFGLTGAAISFMLVMVINNVSAAIYLKWKLNIQTYYFPFLTP